MRRRFLNPYIRYVPDPTNNYLILYTSTDGKTIEFNTDCFNGVKLVQNEYENGQGVLIFDGEITNIGDNAFEECSTLETINIPNSVIIIGDSSFKACSNLSQINLSSNLISIGQYAFSLCTNLKSISLPESLLTIGGRAFEYSGLVDVKIPDSVQNLSYGAFIGCVNLVNINFGDGLSKIYNVLQDCSNLNSITFGKNIISISNANFTNCPNLKNLNFRCVEVLNWFEETTVQNTVTNIVFEDTVEIIDANAFKEFTELTAVKFSAELITIGDNAFYGCIKLSNFTFPTNGNLVTLGEYSFYLCGSSNSTTFSIELPDTITSIGLYAFYGCSKLNSINIPKLIKKLSSHIFYECVNLNSIFLPEGLNTIGNSAFGLTGLKRINIPSTFRVSETNAFENVILDYLEISDVNTYLSATYETGGHPAQKGIKHFVKNSNNENITTTITTSARVTKIPDYSFYSTGDRLSFTITFEADITSIGAYAFYNSDKVSLNWKNVTNQKDLKNLEKIGKYAFYNCGNFNTTLGPTYFTPGFGWVITKLSNIKCKHIESYAFSKCNFTSFLLGLYTNVIDDYAFYNCKLATSVDYSDLYQLHLHRFDYDKEGSIVIGNYAFYIEQNTNCFNAILSATRIPPEIQSNTFKNSAINTRILIPKYKKEIYQNTWSYLTKAEYMTFNLNKYYDNLLL